MTPQQIDELKKSIDTTLKAGIETHVNGKIRHLSEKVDTYIKEDVAWKEMTKREDSEWKERAEPVIQLGHNLQGFGKVSLYVLGFISLLAGAVLAIIKFFK